MAVEVLLWCIAALLGTAILAVAGVRRTTTAMLVYMVALVASTAALGTVGWVLVTDAGLAQTLRLHQCQWVRDSLPGDVGRRTVDRLKHGYSFADVRARRGSEAAHQTCDLIGQNIAEQIRSHDYIKLPWIKDELHGTGIYDALVNLQTVGVLLAHLPSGF